MWGDVGITALLPHFGDIGLVVERAGDGRRVQRMIAEAFHLRGGRHLATVFFARYCGNPSPDQADGRAVDTVVRSRREHWRGGVGAMAGQSASIPEVEQAQCLPDGRATEYEAALLSKF